MARAELLPISLTRRAQAVGGDPGHTVVWLSGEHDSATKLALSAVITHAAALDNSDVVVDLSEVTFMDAAIVGALVRARNQLAARGLSLRVRAPSISARLVLQLCDTGLEAEPHAFHPRGAAPALETWVAVPTERASAARNPIADPAPAMALEVDRAVR